MHTLKVSEEKVTGNPDDAVALMDAGCDSEEILLHCRQTTGHTRGCWVIDLLLGKS